MNPAATIKVSHDVDEEVWEIGYAFYFTDFACLDGCFWGDEDDGADEIGLVVVEHGAEGCAVGMTDEDDVRWGLRLCLIVEVGRGIGVGV